MFQRYSMEAVSGLVNEGYRVLACGRRWGVVAFVNDPEDAQRIVNLLNAHERQKEQARMGRKETA